jgi:hypothetical protein
MRRVVVFTLFAVLPFGLGGWLVFEREADKAARAAALEQAFADLCAPAQKAAFVGTLVPPDDPEGRTVALREFLIPFAQAAWDARVTRLHAARRRLEGEGRATRSAAANREILRWEAGSIADDFALAEGGRQLVRELLRAADSAADGPPPPFPGGAAAGATAAGARP